jgi:hypothetical protein
MKPEGSRKEAGWGERSTMVWVVPIGLFRFSVLAEKGLYPPPEILEIKKGAQDSGNNNLYQVTAAARINIKQYHSGYHR